MRTCAQVGSGSGEAVSIGGFDDKTTTRHAAFTPHHCARAISVSGPRRRAVFQGHPTTARASRVVPVPSTAGRRSVGPSGMCTSACFAIRAWLERAGRPEAPAEETRLPADGTRADVSARVGVRALANVSRKSCHISRVTASKADDIGLHHRRSFRRPDAGSRREPLAERPRLGRRRCE